MFYEKFFQNQRDEDFIISSGILYNENYYYVLVITDFYSIEIV